ncbi:MAG: FtsW/RodA/SpoVE family cell cycle protein [Lentisphaeria bacterium]|nr:FtsW/RodA/SpoVE family cell cycle protein [Lentisphaeria bacterium]
MPLRLHSDTHAAPLPGAEEKLPDSAVSALGLIVITILLLSFGLTMLYSASFTTSGISFFKKQLIWIMAGITCGTTVFVMGYQRICRARGLLLLLCWGMLVAALFFDPVNGARRWIKLTLPVLGDMSIQPSELTKIAVCLFVAGYCTYFSRFFSRLRHVNGLIPLCFYIVVTCGVIWAGIDMGTFLLVLATAGTIMVAGGLYLRYAILGGAAAIAYFAWQIITNPERLSRVMAIFDPTRDQQGESYQLIRSLMALGSGGWLGLGFGKSRLKTRYLPEQHTDFILAVVGEELGLVAIWLVLLLYLLWGFFAVRIAIGARSKLGMLLAFGLAMAVQLQATINLAVISGSAPTKGMPAPFISYGGSNVMSSIIAVFLLLSVAMETLRPGYSDAFLESVRSKFRRKK